MLNFVWKIVCAVAFVSMLCLILTGEISFKEIEESTLEIKDKIEANFIDPIKERYASKSADSSSDSKSIDQTD
tara:strand:- start:32 stop:250 length:219 start_codon:yes stop_codon:yes gene_type:complete